MPHSLRRSLLLACSVFLTACADNSVAPNDPNAPGGSTTGSLLRWSNPATWPDKTVPVAGAAVVIPNDRMVLLDVSPPALKSLQVDGTLVFEEKDLSLTTGWILVSGVLAIGSETAGFQHKAVITLTGPEGEDVLGLGGRAFVINAGTLDLHGAVHTSWTRLAATAPRGATQITLEKSVDWRAGDRLAIASTDFDPTQAEDVLIKDVLGNSVTLQSPLKFAHWGVTQQVSEFTVDERAEVGVLTRNIVVRGDSATSLNGFGGHIIILRGSKAHVEGVELFMMGQKSKLARYPLHWHLADQTAGDYAHDNSVWRSFNRCMTVHGTHNVSVEHNVCYDDIGHGYFLEDGIESNNTFDGNLGMRTRKPVVGEEVLQSDLTPATFWITNPDNSYRNNVAAGSDGQGFWVALPNHPTGFSANPAIFPRRTPLREFSNNVAHSNRSTGLLVDNGPTADGSTTETVSYQPRVTPGVESAIQIAEFKGFVAYKHSFRAVWLRGANLRLTNALLADNSIGATFASSETFLQSSVLIGVTGNNATAFSSGFPIRGFEFYDGRVGAQQVTFVNYQPNARNEASGLGFNRANGFPVNVGNFAEGLRFINANSVYLETPKADKDGDKAAVILDNDGTVTGTAGAFVAVNNPIIVTAPCVQRTDWNAYICNTRIISMRLQAVIAGEVVAPVTVTRDDGVSVNMVGVPSNPSSVLMSVPVGRAFTFHFAGAAPTKPRVYLTRMQPGEFVRVGIPYPGSTFAVYRDGDTTHLFGAVSSVPALDASTGDKYFYDAGAGVIYVKGVPQTGKDAVTLYVDPR
jgi:cell surface hyaluronidase